MPYGLCTAFVESREFLQLQATYHDGTTHRSRLAATSRRTFKFSRRLTASSDAIDLNFNSWRQVQDQLMTLQVALDPVHRHVEQVINIAPLEVEFDPARFQPGHVE